MSRRLSGRIRCAVGALLLLVGTTSIAVEVVKSPNDHRDFKYLELANGIRVLLISDPDTDKAAASLNVAVGSASDPEDRPGLAHFLEHMLFLGTNKYPEPGEYDEFMNAHGGGQNAYTTFENTNYHFDIDKDYLEPALDRFSQFFIAPLFTADYVQREKNAVHSEFKSGIQDDERRAYSVMQQIVNPTHPFSKFSVGNLDTLSDRAGSAIREELIGFYRGHYSSNLMTLAVLGKETLPVLEQWVTKRFTPVQNRHLRPLTISTPLFSPGALPQRLDIEPIRDQRRLQLFFPIPPVAPHYRQKPIEYIANILGHEGPGSLLSLLKERDWAEELGAGLGRDDSDGAALSVSVRLTTAGLAHVEEIVGLIFQTLRGMERNGVERWRYDEQARLSQLAFQFDQKDSPLSAVIDIAELLPRVQARDSVRAHFLMLDYNERLIRQFLGYLRPDNMLMMVAAKTLRTNRRDRWYDTPYSVGPIAPALIAGWQQNSRNTLTNLPGRNPFIPEVTTIWPQPAQAATIPERIKQRPGFELWFKQDGTFRQPRASFYFSVRSPVANDTPVHAVLTELLTQIIGDELNEYAYAARLAGLSFSIYPHIRGFTVRVSGYSDKLDLLLERIINTLKKPTLAEDVFAREQQVLVRHLENRQHDDPYEQTIDEVAKLLVRPSWSDQRRLDAAAQATVKSLRAFLPELLGRIQVIALAHGNLQRRDAERMGNALVKNLVNPAAAATVVTGHIVQLAPDHRYLRNLKTDHPDSAVTTFFQGVDRSPGERAGFDLLAQILEAPFYNQLRTEKQLGYVVNVGSLPLLEVPGISFVIQSPTIMPVELEAQIDVFIRHYATVLDSMPEAVFEGHREGLLSRILRREDRLQQRSDRYWREIDLGRHAFDSREQLADAARKLTRQDMQKLYRRVLLESARRLTVRSAQSDIEEATPDTAVIIDDPDTFSTGYTLTSGIALEPTASPAQSHGLANQAPSAPMPPANSRHSYPSFDYP